MSDVNGAEPNLDLLEPLLQDGSFEESLEALEAVVEHLERGKLSIADAVAWYEAGLRLTRRCGMLLEQAELRISVLEETYGMVPRDAAPWDSDDK